MRGPETCLVNAREMERQNSILSTPARQGNVPVALNPASNHQHASWATLGGASKPNVAQDRLIVGVDFGTTYSGAFRSCGEVGVSPEVGADDGECRGRGRLLGDA